ncbi:SAM-dependent methyltransferase [Caulobacter sp. SL161]|uniref:SAM-dependent methyltransferase n=1 Tax=Caulobacter sp. SL161 TaxID=2995156 RepID=UPI00227624E6|nr:SAM-dependent methyltransferase [Caulobacter sp. SL161]MCY1646173.1 SAM-dependent methyltransferase [Caulobacter sp. SL161]
MSIKMTPIGRVEGGRTVPDDDDWGDSRARIVLDPARFDDEALMGLDTFSHAEVIFVFDKVGDDQIVTGARHPRGNKDWPRIGIFAQRGKNRPNRIGVTVCEIVSVAGRVLEVRGLDAIDGTPVLDIKPVMSGFAPRGDVREPDWARAIMEAYW